MRTGHALLSILLLATGLQGCGGDPGSREVATPEDSTKDHPAEVDEYLHDEDQARSPDFEETLGVRPAAPPPGAPTGTPPPGSR